MILLDANILLYLFDEKSPHHAATKAWFEAAMTERRNLCLCWPSILAFCRITTNPRLFSYPNTIEEAVGYIDDLLAQSNVRLLLPTSEQWSLFRTLLLSNDVRWLHITDANIAAHAFEHGASLCTNDGDFHRFKGLRIENPTAKQ